jgi:hypothetical protein
VRVGLSLRHGGSKLHMKWCGVFCANIYNCLNLITSKNVQLDVSSEVVSMSSAGMDGCRGVSS